MIKLSVIHQEMSARQALPQSPPIVSTSIPNSHAAERVAACVSDAIELELQAGGDAVTLLVEIDVVFP